MCDICLFVFLGGRGCNELRFSATCQFCLHEKRDEGEENDKKARRRRRRIRTDGRTTQRLVTIFMCGGRGDKRGRDTVVVAPRGEGGGGGGGRRGGGGWEGVEGRGG